MSEKPKEKIETIKGYLLRSQEAIDAAKVLIANGFYRDGVSKAYFSMFYAATAALISIDVLASKHSGVISQFGFHFVRTGKIDPIYYKKLRKAFDDRDTADYRIVQPIIDRVGQARLSDAEEFLEEIKRILFQWDNRTKIG